MRLFQVDTFTRAPFAGNPAAVCLLEREAEADWMQSLASELRMPATAFVSPVSGGESWQLRWFTPRAELEICGHGTLAAAHVLWETGSIEEQATAAFETGAGPISAFREAQSIFISLPAGTVLEAHAPADLLAGIGITPVSVWRTPLDYLVEVKTPEVVAALRPDPERLTTVETRGVIVTSEGGADGVDFTSRFFAPRLGLPEDSVTGSAHASLGPFWSARLGKTSLRARQASPRGGFLDVRVDGELVEIGGPVLTIARGELLI